MGMFVPCVVDEEGYLLTREINSLKDKYKMCCEALENYKIYYLGKKYTETDKSKIIADIMAKIYSQKKKMLDSNSMMDDRKFFELIVSETQIDSISKEIFLIEKSLKRYDENYRKSLDVYRKDVNGAILEIAKLLNNTFGSISSDMLDGFKEETKECLDFYNMLDGEHRKTLNRALARKLYESAEKAYMWQVKKKQEECEHKFSVPVSKTVVEFEFADPTAPMDQRGKYLTKDIKTCMCEKCGLIDTKIVDYHETPIIYPVVHCDEYVSRSEDLVRKRKNRK